MIYKSKLKELFTGSFIEVQKICTILDDFNIKYIIQDEKKSAILAGFGITNLFWIRPVYLPYRAQCAKQTVIWLLSLQIGHLDLGTGDHPYLPKLRFQRVNFPRPRMCLLASPTSFGEEGNHGGSMT